MVREGVSADVHDIAIGRFDVLEGGFVAAGFGAAIEMKVRSAVPSVNATQNPESTLSSVGPTCRMPSLSKTLRIVSAQGPVPRMPACRASTPIWRTACSVL